MEKEDTPLFSEDEIAESTPAFFNVIKVDTFINKRDKHTMKPKIKTTSATDKNDSDEKSSSSDSERGKPKKKKGRPKKKINKCEYCENCSYSKESFAMHLAKHLSDERICKLCKLKFDSLMGLSEHIGQQHPDRSFECQSCGKKFILYGDMKFHKNTSRCGENMKVCKECNFCSSQFMNMKVHSRYHKRPKHAHKCEHCSYSAPIYLSLILHSKVHEKCFKCGYCGKEFNDLKLLKTHMPAHKEDKDYFECEICPFKCVALA